MVLLSSFEEIFEKGREGKIKFLSLLVDQVLGSFVQPFIFGMHIIAMC